MEFIPWMQGFCNICKSISDIPVSNLKNKNYMIISIEIEKIQNLIPICDFLKIFQKVDIEGPYLNIIKTICNKLTADIILNGEKPKSLPLRSEIRQECPFLLLYST